MLACSRFSQTGSDTANARRVAIDWTSTSRSSPGGDAKRGGVGARTHADGTHAPQTSHKPNSRPTASLCHARHCELCPTTSFKRNATHFRDAAMATGGALATHARFPPLGCGAESESRLASGGGTWNLELCISCSRFFWPRRGTL